MKRLLFFLFSLFLFFGCSDRQKEPVTKQPDVETKAEAEEKAAAPVVKKPIGEITDAKGSVTILREKKKEPGKKGSKVFLEDDIATGDKSLARILFDDQSIVAIGKNSDFSVRDFVKEGKNTKANFDIAKGTFEVISGRIGKIAPEKFRIKAGTVTMGIRGTHIVGNIIKPSHVVVGCVDGEIFVSAKDKKKFVKDKKKVKIAVADIKNPLTVTNGQMVEISDVEEIVVKEDIQKKNFVEILEDTGNTEKKAVDIVGKYVKLISTIPHVYKNYEKRVYEVLTALKEKDVQDALYKVTEFKGKGSYVMDSHTGILSVKPDNEEETEFEFVIEATLGKISESKHFRMDVGDFVINRNYDIGRDFIVYIDNNGYIWGIGKNDYGQLGDNPSDSAKAYLLNDSNDWQRVFAGSYHFIAQKNNGSLWGMGRNLNGELGIGTFKNSHTLQPIGSERDWKQVSAGRNYTMAIKQDGSLWGWGDNEAGKLGDGGVDSQSKPIRIGESNDWQKVATGDYHTIALKTDGTLYSWGKNEFGQLGNSKILAANIPVKVSKELFKDVTCGGSYTAAITRNGKLWLWGVNDNGQLGDGTTKSRNEPVKISDDAWERVYAGSNHTIAQKSDGTFWGWGDNRYRQLSDEKTRRYLKPVRLQDKEGLVIVSIPMGDSTLIVDKKAQISIVGKIKKEKVKTYDYLVAEWIRE